ncbi:MAG TPA: endolytic transglycosylase MltG [Lachnospiraceae bacterium]|nr:endolytic transglycosylase MltG [Lachnospiraceae bacterium]
MSINSKKSGDKLSQESICNDSGCKVVQVVNRYASGNHNKSHNDGKRHKSCGIIAFSMTVICFMFGLNYFSNVANACIFATYGLQTKNNSSIFTDTIDSTIVKSDASNTEISNIDASNTDASNTDVSDTGSNDSESDENDTNTVTPTKYGILIADSKGGYTFYDMNGGTGTQHIEVTTTGKVMIPLRRVCSYLPDMKYSYDFGSGKATLINSKTGKRLVISKDSKTAYVYTSSNAKAKKVSMNYKMFLSNDSNAALVEKDTLKNIFKYASGCKYFASSYLETAGYDISNYIGIIVYDPYRKVADLPKATEVKYYSEKAESNIIKVTIPEGYSVAQIFNLLVSKGVCASKDVLFDVCNNYDFSKYPFINDLGADETRCFRLEGYLYPDTYQFYGNSNGYEILDKILKNTKSKLTQADYDRAAELGYTMDEILRIASIIEKEVGDASQQSMVSSILHNRLKISMKLQCDATVYYVERYIKPFISGDKNRYNEYYNTRKCKALPSGAICNPGRTAINAALYPQDTKYLYFCSDAQGKYYYAETWEGHQSNLALAKVSEGSN